MTTLDKNKLLAEVAEVIGDNNCLTNGVDYFAIEGIGEWQPDKDLNQLMLVVEKIRLDYGIHILVNKGVSYVKIYKYIGNTTIVELTNESLHKALYDACVEYVNINTQDKIEKDGK